MKKVCTFISLMAVCISLFAWDSPIALPNVGDARLRIVGQNALNYHNNYDATNKSCWNDAEFEEKTLKMANVFNTLKADIIVICEAGRNDEALLGYVSNAMNTLVGKDLYAYVVDNFEPEVATAGNYQSIKTGYVYNYKKLAAIGSSFSPYNGGDYLARMRVQLFMEIETGEYFYLSGNHFKAMDSSADGGESKRLTNVSYLLSTLRTLNEDPDILIMGDLNSYMGDQPIINLQNAGYEEQLVKYDENAYTYIYGGQKGILDHVMANSTMAQQITGAYAYNINNASYTDKYLYNYSDHDPVVVGLKLKTEPPTPGPGPDPEPTCPDYQWDFRTGLNDFTAQGVSGNANWNTNETYGLTINGYNKEDNQERWLVSPKLNLSKATSATLKLNHQIYYDNGETGDYVNDQTMWISSDYTDNVTTANWTQLVLSDYPQKYYAEATSAIPSAFLTDNVRIAFKYTAATAANSNYWEVKTAAVTGVCETEAIEQTEMPTLPARKFFRNGVLYIYHNGNVYNIMGTRVE